MLYNIPAAILIEYETENRKYLTEMVISRGRQKGRVGRDIWQKEGTQMKVSMKDYSCLLTDRRLALPALLVALVACLAPCVLQTVVFCP